MNRGHILLLPIAAFLLFGCVSELCRLAAVAAERDYSKDRIMTVLSYDAIPAIKDPEFVSASEADMKDNSPVIGVSFNGESHAYSIYLLNGHEIVNDVVGGVKAATTW